MDVAKKTEKIAKKRAQKSPHVRVVKDEAAQKALEAALKKISSLEKEKIESKAKMRHLDAEMSHVKLSSKEAILDQKVSMAAFGQKMEAYVKDVEKRLKLEKDQRLRVEAKRKKETRAEAKKRSSSPAMIHRDPPEVVKPHARVRSQTATCSPILGGNLPVDNMGRANEIIHGRMTNEAASLHKTELSGTMKKEMKKRSQTHWLVDSSKNMLLDLIHSAILPVWLLLVLVLTLYLHSAREEMLSVSSLAVVYTVLYFLAVAFVSTGATTSALNYGI